MKFSLFSAALVLIPMPALAGWEGAWSLGQPAGCEIAQYDTIAVMEDHEGRLRAWTSRKDFGIAYHQFLVDAQGQDRLEGTTVAASLVAGDLTATMQDDEGSSFEGFVVDAACPNAPSFMAQRQAPAGDVRDFTPGASVSVQDIVGSWTFTHGRDPVTLHLVALRDGRIVGDVQTRFGSSAARFDVAQLSGHKLKLWSVRSDDSMLKWSLEFGSSDGAPALSGWALSSLGRYVRLHGVRRANP